MSSERIEDRGRRGLMSGLPRLLAAWMCVFTLLTCLCTGVHAEEPGRPPAEELLGGMPGACGAESVQDWLDGALTEDAANTAWYAIALAQGEQELDFSAYEAALLKYVRENEVRSAATRQKLALALIAAGSTDGFIASVMEDSIGKQGIMSLVFGLHLLNNGYTSPAYTLQDVRDQILAARLSDGGWAVTGSVSDVDVTAMTLQALAPLCAEDAEVRSAVDAALELLSSRRSEDGEFFSYGKANAESAAQVLTALAVLGIDPKTDARFCKNGNDPLTVLLRYRLEDGSFCHAAGEGFSASATEQVYFALTAVSRLGSGKSSVYLMDRRRPGDLRPADPADTVGGDQAGTLPGGDASDPSGTGAGDRESGKPSYRLWVSLAIIGIGLAVCLVLFCKGKRKLKDHLVVLAICAAAVAAVCFVNIRGAGDPDAGGQTTKEPIGTVTLTIRCDTAVGKAEGVQIPSDGVILATVELTIGEGDTVYSVLREAAKAHHIRVDDSAGYVTGIAGLYETDLGALSGWVFRVNGVVPSKGSTEVRLSDGDRIEWLYTCSMGNDLG